MTAPSPDRARKIGLDPGIKVEEEKKARARRLETINLIQGNKGNRSLLAVGPEQSSRNSSFPVLAK